MTEYVGGDCLAPHVDRLLWGPTVCGLSLLSSCEMELTPVSTSGGTSSPGGGGCATSTFHLAPRSLYVMGGASRLRYSHALTNIHERRISLTLRTLAEGIPPPGEHAPPQSSAGTVSTA